MTGCDVAALGLACMYGLEIFTHICARWLFPVRGCPQRFDSYTSTAEQLYVTRLQRVRMYLSVAKRTWRILQSDCYCGHELRKGSRAARAARAANRVAGADDGLAEPSSIRAHTMCTPTLCAPTQKLFLVTRHHDCITTPTMPIAAPHCTGHLRVRTHTHQRLCFAACRLMLLDPW